MTEAPDSRLKLCQGIQILVDIEIGDKTVEVPGIFLHFNDHQSGIVVLHERPIEELTEREVETLWVPAKLDCIHPRFIYYTAEARASSIHLARWLQPPCPEAVMRGRLLGRMDLFLNQFELTEPGSCTLARRSAIDSR